MNKIKMRKILKTIINEIIKGFSLSSLTHSYKNHTDLYNLSFIGPDLIKRPIEKIMDFDIVVVLRDPMTIKNYSEIQQIFSNLQIYSNKYIDVTFRIADGPIKPTSKKTICIFLHVILHTINSYKTSPLLLVKNSWQNESKTLFGKHLKTIQSIDRITRKMVIDGKLGLRHTQKLISNRQSAALQWFKDSHNKSLMKMKLIPIHFKKNNEILELCYYSVLRGASNALRYKLKRSNDLGIDEHTMKLFSTIFPKLFNKNLPILFYKEKRKLRQGKIKPTLKSVKYRCEQANRFLKELERDLAEREKQRRHPVRRDKPA